MSLIFEIMICYLCFVAWICISSSSAQQYYDPSNCSSSENSNSGSRYTCNLPHDSCSTFLVYRANQNFQTISDISKLFNMSSDGLLQINNLTSSSQVLKPGKEVLLPFNCSCSVGLFYQANLTYKTPETTTFSEVACGVFEGLLKSKTLAEENLPHINDLEAGSVLYVPLRCACPDNFTSGKRVKYLITYPIIQGDDPNQLSQKFDISTEDFLEVNTLARLDPLFPDTTVLIPISATPISISQLPDSPPPTPEFLYTIPAEKEQEARKPAHLYVASSIIGSFLLLILMLACGFSMKGLRKWKSENLKVFTVSNSLNSCSPMGSSPRSTQTGTASLTSCLSPDLLVGIKYRLLNYSIEELKKATKDFSEETKIDGSTFKGLLNDIEVMIKRVRFEDIRPVIDLHSKINHINIVTLLGVCYSESDFSWSCLVFEMPKNGCLRDCLSDPCNPLHWHRRTQIAFDIATGLHYLHCCAFPSYAHMKISSRNIFITANWRAKLADIGMASATKLARGNDRTENHKGWVAPEYLLHGSVSETVDIFAFGVVLLELIAAKDNIDEKSFKDSIGFLGEPDSERGCFEGLRGLMDPNLKDYPLAEALCLAVLAKACVADDPQHRPTMDDIMKVLGRMT
ncbi:hypothetical protein L6164_019074 [Bauhinia variegata]|uniref:Uncharacterized protein n=1 Tax=Bauhinia variegata TaxID=167791 RepID=A0ACB9NEW7_BAUVA|nr:hypothetical protein L6164_019074 [Bauhinia variegata]